MSESGMTVTVVSNEVLGPLPKPRYWMTNESARRLANGGNSKGAVPVHDKRSATAKNGLFTEAQMHFYAADQVERCAKLCEESDLFEYDDPGGFFARLIRESK